MPSPKPRGSPRSRERSKQETRDALLDAGIAEFAAHGLDDPSLDGICDRAGFTRGAFYVHFRDRDDFLVAVAERVLARFLDAVIATGDQAHDLEHSIAGFMGAVTAAAAAGGRPRRGRSAALAGIQVHRLLEACVRSTAIRARVVGLIHMAIGRLSQATAAAQAVHTVRRDVSPQHVSTILVGAAIGLLTLVEIGMPLDFDAGRATVETLLRVAGPWKR